MPATYLTQRGRRFHLRLRIPTDLFQFFGRRELHRSLRVNDRQTARVMARTLQGRAEQTFATIRHRQSLGDDPASLLELARTLYADNLPSTRGTVIQRNVPLCLGDRLRDQQHPADLVCCFLIAS